MLHLKNNSDLLLKYLIRLKRTSLEIGAIELFLFNLPFFLYAFATNHLFSDGYTIGVLDDVNYLLLNFIGIPCIWAFYFWLPFGIDGVVEQIKNKNIIPDKSKLSLYISKLVIQQDNFWWFILAFLVAFIFQIGILVPQHLHFKNIIGTNLGILALYEIMYLPAFYATVVVIFRGSIFTWWLLMSFSDAKIKIWPLDPDKASGLGFIGKYIAKTGYIIGVFGFALAVVIVTEGRQLQIDDLFYTKPLTLIPLIAYFVIAPIAFFAPIWQVHLAMIRARDEWLEKISKEYNSVLEKIPKIDGAGVNKLAELEKLNNAVSKSPIYPFKTPDFIAYLTRVGGALVTPLVIPFFSTWIGNIIKLDK